MNHTDRISPAKQANTKLDFYETFNDDFFNSEFIELVITGVPTDVEGQPIWESMDDLLARPYSHGLIVAISTISQVIRTIEIHLCHNDVKVPRLNIRFEAKITDVFAENNSLVNPIAWIHIGHGIKEYDYKIIDPVDDWDDDEIEQIPGLSNGNENTDYISCESISNAISSMRGQVLFVGLPLCYGSQVGDFLTQNEKILFIHGPYSFSVNSGSEFYDCDKSTTLPENSLIAWTEWVGVFEKMGRKSLLEFAKNSKK